MTDADLQQHEEFIRNIIDSLTINYGKEFMFTDEVKLYHTKDDPEQIEAVTLILFVKNNNNWIELIRGLGVLDDHWDNRKDAVHYATLSAWEQLAYQFIHKGIEATYEDKISEPINSKGKEDGNNK